MNRKTIIILALLILAPLIIYFLWPSDKNRIKRLFREGAAAVQTEDLDGVMSKVSYHYTDEHGLTYLLVKDGIKNLFNKMDNFTIEYEIKHIEVTDDTATAELDIRVIARYKQDTGYIVGDAAEPAEALFSLEKERTKWLIAKAKGVPLYY